MFNRVTIVLQLHTCLQSNFSVECRYRKTSLPLPRYYCVVFTVPRYYREIFPIPAVITAVLPLSPLPCHPLARMRAFVPATVRATTKPPAALAARKRFDGQMNASLVIISRTAGSECFRAPSALKRGRVEMGEHVIGKAGETAEGPGTQTARVRCAIAVLTVHVESRASPGKRRLTDIALV